MKRTPNIWSEHHSKENFTDEYPEGSMVAPIIEVAEKYPDYTALEFQNKKISYSQMIENIELIAKSLLEHGIKKGDFVSVVAPNTPQALMMVYAVNRIGAVANMIHPLLSAIEIKRFVENVDSRAVLTFDMLYPKFKDIEWETTEKPLIILARIVDALPTLIKPIYLLKNKLDIDTNPNHNTVYWNSFLKKGKQRKEPLPVDDGKGDDLAAVLYSGGTTGVPKGVMIHNRAFNCMAIQTSEIRWVEIDEIAGKKALALMPVFHGFGLASCMHSMLYWGMHVFLVPKFDYRACSKLIFNKKINHIYAVPALFEALSRSEEIEKKDLSFMELLACAGDKGSEKLFNKMNKYLKNGGSSVQMAEAYGITECLSCVTMTPWWADRKGIGLPLPDLDAKICKFGSHETVPFGEDGELCITGPTIMRGYYKNETETKAALQVHDDGRTWLHTGDIACMDEDGYIYYRQRHSKMIITSGYNVFPSQIEEVINKCAGVNASCVVGVEDRSVGQRVVAVVQPTSMDIDLDALKSNIIEQCKNEVAEYAMPREVVFKEEFPRTAMGKVNFKQITADMNKKG